MSTTSPECSTRFIGLWSGRDISSVTFNVGSRRQRSNSATAVLDQQVRAENLERGGNGSGSAVVVCEGRKEKRDAMT